MYMENALVLSNTYKYILSGLNNCLVIITIFRLLIKRGVNGFEVDVLSLD